MVASMPIEVVRVHVEGLESVQHHKADPGRIVPKAQLTAKRSPARGAPGRAASSGAGALTGRLTGARQRLNATSAGLFRLRLPSASTSFSKPTDQSGLAAQAFPLPAP